MSEPPPACDILIIGGGNAGYSAAVAAAQSDTSLSLVLIDKCPSDWAGGNSFFTAGAMRTVHQGLPDLLPLVNNVDESTAARIDLEPYRTEDFTRDMHRICSGRSHPRLSEILIGDSNETIKWLAGNGIRFQLSFNRQAYEVDGRYKFWGGLALKTEDGGQGLMEDHQRAAKKHNIAIFHSTPAIQLHKDLGTGAIHAVSVLTSTGKSLRIRVNAVILAAGGFEANARMRAAYLGPGWDLAYVRGTPYNTGDLLEMAIRDVGAAPAGNWSGCHSTCWDANASPERGDRKISNQFTKSGYPLGIMVNSEGVRFVDEGIDLRNFTYAKFGRAVLQQPNGFAYQIWDSRTIPLLRSEEYRDEIVAKVHGSSIAELADKLAAEAGLQNRDALVDTIDEYNRAVYQNRKEYPNAKFDPSVKDGLSTQSTSLRLSLAKSNWAQPIDQAPFLAVKIASGVTFTFGGLAIEPETAGIMSSTNAEEVIPGLFAVGEMVGGLFYNNYPGGSGLTSGAVFGRRAGRAAAKVARQSRKEREDVEG